MTDAFNVGSEVTGVDSSATADIIDVVILTGTTGYLILDNVVGDFEDDEVLADDGGTPGGADANGTQTEAIDAFNVGATVTGADSGATGEILSIVEETATTGYLVIGSVVGTFDVFEIIVDDDGVAPGTAMSDGAQATVSATINLPAQLIYNSNDAPLT